VNEPQLRRLVAHEHGSERGAEAAAVPLAGSLDDVVRPRQQRRRDCEAEGLGGLERFSPLLVNRTKIGVLGHLAATTIYASMGAASPSSSI
jgi:hypothetical protein